MVKLILLAAIIYAFLPASSAAIGQQLCIGDGTDRSVRFTYKGPSTETYTTVWVEGSTNATACKVAVTGTTEKMGQLTVKFGDCDTTDNGNGQISMMNFFVTVNDGVNADPMDVRFIANCSFDTTGNPDLVSSQSMNLTATSGQTKLKSELDVKVTMTVFKTGDSTYAQSETCVITDKNNVTFNFNIEVENEHKLYKSVKILSMVAKAQTDNKGTGPKLEMVKDGCTLKNGGLFKTTTNKGATVDAKDANNKTILRTTLDNGFPCFQRLGFKGAISFDAVVRICTRAASCAVTCSRRKRRAIDDDGMITRNVTVNWNIVENTDVEQAPKEKKELDVTNGYTSNTVFFAIVTILAVLLVLTIGLTAFFATRARAAVVTLSGKDNPVYG